jgi:hypothetical protein
MLSRGIYVNPIYQTLPLFKMEIDPSGIPLSKRELKMLLGLFSGLI